MNWQFKHFDNLNPEESKAIEEVRRKIFAENGEKDLNDIFGTAPDTHCHHLFAMVDDHVAAYCRVIDEGDRFRIARVLVHPNYRGRGLGQELVTKAVEYIQSEFDGKHVTLSALSYVKRMYEKLGFQSEGEEFDMNGIPSIEMTKRLD